MPITTALTRRLGISHRLLLRPMDLVADARLTRAVSDAGGLGMLGGGYGDEAWLRRELDLLAGQGVRFGAGFITWGLAHALVPPPKRPARMRPNKESATPTATRRCAAASSRFHVNPCEVPACCLS